MVVCAELNGGFRLEGFIVVVNLIFGNSTIWNFDFCAPFCASFEKINNE